MSSRLLLPVSVLLLSVVLIGCQREPEPVKVRGTVSFASKPVQDGAIYFSTPGKPPEMLAINNGRFEGSVKPGDKRVEIFGYEGSAAPEPAGGEQPPVPV